ncbi:MAG: cobalt ECF transporter T component CbiQ [Dethiobacteria bacterium]
MIAEASVRAADQESIFDRWEARLKLPGMLALIFSYAFVRELWLLVPLLITAATIYLLSRLPLKYLISRLRLPGFFLLVMAIILPFWSGETVLWNLGPFALRLEGVLGLLLIAGKFIGIMIVVVTLFGTTPLSQLTMALKSIGIPWLLTDLLIFTHRYIFQLAGDLQRMRTAARLRGFSGKSINSIKPLAYITGSMLVRSHEQSERVYQAMTLRGYGNSSLPHPVFKPTTSDYILLVSVVTPAVFFIVAQFIL